MQQTIPPELPMYISDLLDSTYPHTSGIENDLVLVYALRNFAAHSIASQQLIYEKFEKIIHSSECAFLFNRIIVLMKRVSRDIGFFVQIKYILREIPFSPSIKVEHGEEVEQSKI